MSSRLLPALLLCMACGTRTATTPPAVAPPDAAPVTSAPPDAAAPPPDAPPPPTPPDAAPPDAAPAPRPKAKCQADAKHCCLPGGKLVVPGGCQPIYRDHEEPATVRGADGTCQRIECNVKCLPGDARIATPLGERAVATLAAGDLVWTADCDGQPLLAPVLAVTAVRAPPSAEVLVITLDDGRGLRGSAGHPTIDGASFGALVPGAPLDGARVTAITRAPLGGDYTHDLLPAGPTGAYWSDGVLIGSTLAPATGCAAR